MSHDVKLISVALRDFALPVPRTGSIESQSGYGRAAAEGREIHVRVQKKRAKSDPAYESEVRVSRSFDREGYRFRIDGRMDGIFRREPPLIEEIKTGFNVRELGRLLSENPLAHPYGLQLATYGYFHWLEHKVVPELFFHLVSTRGSDSLDLEQPLDLRAYEKWLELRLGELVRELLHHPLFFGQVEVCHAPSLRLPMPCRPDVRCCARRSARGEESRSRSGRRDCIRARSHDARRARFRLCQDGAGGSTPRRCGRSGR